MGNVLDALFCRSTIYKSSLFESRKSDLLTSDVIILGGSNGLVSYESKRIAKAWNKRVINLSEDDTNIPIHLLQLRMLLRRGVSPQIVILNLGSLGATPSRNILRYAPYLGHDPDVNEIIKQTGYRHYAFDRAFPVLRWARHNNSLLFPLAYSLLVNHEYRHRFDVDGDYEYPVPKVPPPNPKVGNNESKLDLNQPLLREFRDLCASSGIRLVIVSTPYLSTTISVTGDVADYHNFANIIDSPIYFYDSNHLNVNGKRLFTDHFLSKVHP